MNENFEPLNEYLDALDTTKEKVAKKTRGMSAREVKAYFAGSAQRLRKLIGFNVRVRRGAGMSRPPSTTDAGSAANRRQRRGRR